MRSFLLLLLILLPVFGFTQNTSDEQALRLSEQIDSEIMKESIEYLIDLPEAYYSSDQKYHVLYLFDSQWEALFDFTVSTVRCLEGIGVIPVPVILVGVKQNNRLKEFTPSVVNIEANDRIGGGDNYLKFIEKELIPKVDENYRTENYRIAIGHSLGGLFVTHAMLKNSELFNAYLAISSNYKYDEKATVHRMAELAKNTRSLNRFFYFSIGDKGYTDQLFLEGNVKVDSILQKSNINGLVWEYQLFDGQNHNTSPFVSIPDGLTKLYSQWEWSEEIADGIFEEKTLDPFEEIDKFYTHLSKWVGYEVSPSVDLLNGMGYEYIEREDYEKAFMIFDKAIEMFPNDANIYDSKGEAFEAAGKLEEAKKYYQLAINKLELPVNKSYEYNRPIFEEHLAKVEEKLK